MIRIINKPHDEGENHHVFELYDILTVKNPGEEAGCKNRKPGYGVERYRSKRKSDGKSDEKKLERNGYFELIENKVPENAYDSCDNAAHSAEKIMGNSHKGELNALDNKDSVLAFDKSGQYHYGAGNYGNYVCDYDYDIVIQFHTSVLITKNCPVKKAGQQKIL